MSNSEETNGFYNSSTETSTLPLTSNFDIEGPSDFSSQKPKLKGKKISYHFRSLTLSILLWTSLFIFVKDRIELDEGFSGFTDIEMNFVDCFAIISISLYLIECFWAGSREYLSKNLHVYDAEILLNEIKSRSPSITYHVECYHYETKLKTGQRKSLISQNTPVIGVAEKIITFRDSAMFNFIKCIDKTPEFFKEGERRITKLKISKRYDFHDHKSRQSFESQQTALYQKNQGTDSNISQTVDFDIPGLKNTLLVLPPGVALPCGFGASFYWIFSCLSLSWFYRMWLEMICDSKEITVIKVFQC